MSPELIGMLVQIPVVGVFIYFVLQSNKAHQANVLANQVERQAWLSSQNAQWQNWLASQNNQWQGWIEEQNRIYLTKMVSDAERSRVERRQLIEALRNLDGEISRLSTITLLMYAAVRGKEAEVADIENGLVRDLSGD